MKRSSGLILLSREHHSALVLAKRALRSCQESGGATARCVAELAAAFPRELEPHFQVEERGLLPALRNAGLAELVERTLAEHAALRALALRLAEGDTSAVPDFGALLEAHVRFEERELFPATEAALTPEFLLRVDRLMRHARSTP